MALEGSSQERHQNQEILPAGNAGAGGGPAATIVLLPLRVIPAPPEFANSPFANKPVDIDHRRRVPYGWQRCLNLKNGRIFFKDLLTEEEDEDEDEDEDEMSRRGKSPKLDLRLNLSTHHGHDGADNGNSPNSSSSPSSSPPSSCLSSETEQGRRSGSPEATSMVLVGCPRCLMYVMLAGDDPKCPKCKSTVLLDFLNDPKNAATPTKKTRKN